MRYIHHKLPKRCCILATTIIGTRICRDVANRKRAVGDGHRRQCERDYGEAFQISGDPTHRWFSFLVEVRGRNLLSSGRLDGGCILFGVREKGVPTFRPGNGSTPSGRIPVFPVPAFGSLGPRDGPDGPARGQSPFRPRWRAASGAPAGLTGRKGTPPPRSLSSPAPELYFRLASGSRS